MLANIIEKFQNIYYVIYISRSCVESSFFHTLHLPCFSAEAYSEPFNHLRWSVFEYPVNDLRCSLFTQKHSMLLDARRDSEYICVQIVPGNALRNHNKHLMGYFEFLHRSKIICLPFIFQKNYTDNVSSKN